MYRLSYALNGTRMSAMCQTMHAFDAD